MQVVMALATDTIDEAGYTVWLREHVKRKRRR